MPLTLSRRPGELVVIYTPLQTIKILVGDVKGERVKLSIAAPADVVILRGEVDRCEEPCCGSNSPPAQEHIDSDGHTLRDQFACAAMNGLLVASRATPTSAKRLAGDAYRMADEMLNVKEATDDGDDDDTDIFEGDDCLGTTAERLIEYFMRVA